MNKTHKAVTSLQTFNETPAESAKANQEYWSKDYYAESKLTMNKTHTEVTDAGNAPRAYFSTRESARLFQVKVKLARLNQDKQSHEAAEILREIARRLDAAEIIVSNPALSHGQV